ncbi:unnamed protein product [Chrysodeixis includens]|uniref:Uncharacterized protein n=1 Tax=Chrysodeixis includens TaxID=689277 RepID=A0A9P0BVG1_CHRIL|nr:unnamed protein product [Chrysodeixis includens]
MGEQRNSYDKPLPNDFDRFLPWACTQLGVEAIVVVTRTVLVEYVSVVASERERKGKGKSKAPKPPSTEATESIDVPSSTLISMNSDLKDETIIRIESVYDSSYNLVHIRFHNNKTIPSSILKIIGLIIKFYPTLTMISINSGLQMQAMYQISKFLPLSKITDICMDYTYLREANYHVLLDHKGLKTLSISKCKITDTVLKTICNKLMYPNTACKTLFALNISTNIITDVGAKYLADMLRTNRNLSYLNVADNGITDEGAEHLFDCLSEFPLKPNELLAKRTRHMAYLKEKSEMIIKTVQELKINDYEKKMGRRKSVKPMVSLKKKEKEMVAPEAQRSLSHMDTMFLEKAEALVENILGHFHDPYSPEDTFFKDGQVYCYGNNTLSYLNVAYNNLTYSSLKKLCDVIVTQKYLARKPRGLVNVVIEGNFLPERCEELKQIDEILEAALPSYRKGSTASSMRKRGSVK